MQLRARLHPLNDESRATLLRLLPAKHGRPTSDRYPVGVGDEILHTIFKEGDAAGGFAVSAEAVFTKRERRSVTHFEVVCKKYVPESEIDYEHNADLCDGTPPISAGGEAPIRLPSGFGLTRIKLKPNMVGAIGQWTLEYIIGSAVFQVFEQAQFSGWSAKPVLNLRTQSPFSEVVQLFSDAVLSPCTIDCSVERIQSAFPEEDGHLRHLGCLSYPAAALEDVPDFARTAEPWGGWNGLSSWVVSARVADAFAAHKLRGWAFRPVMVTESDLYRHYLQAWQVLCEAVARSQRSEFDGGRW
ncbi:MAG: hypothetical protein QNJ22_23160 [Desulfosarcinaceae bacterium]|nr:hypothetical protein [Desulfosarcinaceae bacterium]